MSRARRLSHRRFGFVLLIALACLVPQSASAWKPKHHISTGNEAIAAILAGQDRVTIDGIDYVVPPVVAQVIRNYPAYYRAGCIGPDGFPDLMFGQTLIHPDWKGDGGTYTHEWLAHIYREGWNYYNAHGGNAQGQQALAFTYGFLTHAAGDQWGHTLINSFSGGAWPEIPGGDINIAIRHLIVESYVTEHVPPTDMTIEVPNDFMYTAFIANDAAFDLSRNSTLAFGIPYFKNLRARLVAEKNSLECSGWPWEWINCGKIAYINAWIDDIDAGLRAWPERMTRINKHWFVDEYDGHMDDGMADLKAFAYDHLLSMYGAPDFIGGFLSGWDALIDWVEGLINIDIPSIGDLVVYIVESMYGIDFDQLKDYYTNCANYVNSPPLFAPDTSARLDALMHLQGGVWDGEQFAANKNTIVLAKMLLLDAAGMNQLLENCGVQPLYGGENDLMPAGMRDNAMLGFIRTIDGDHQWRRTPIDNPSLQHSEGMPLWTECHARQLVFRRLFTDWEAHVPAGNFPDAQDACECLYDLAPSITVTLDRDVLWPPNHKLSPIRATVTVEDDSDPNPTFQLLGISSNEPDNGTGDGNTVGDIQGADFGSADVEFLLRSERAGGGTGRIYTITYAGFDAGGKSDTTEIVVRVPHDQSGQVMAASGFLPDGTGLVPGASSFCLVIPSPPRTKGVTIYDLERVDPSRAFVGNHLRQFPAISSRVLDVTGDMVGDLILEYPASVAGDMARLSKAEGEGLGFRYEERWGAGFLVPDLFALGVPAYVPGDPARPAPEELAGKGDDRAPLATALVGIQPNPFNPAASIQFDLATAGRARIDVYDIRGARVRTLRDGGLPVGRHAVTWDGRNDDGRPVPSGVYFVRLVTAETTQTAKAILAK